MSENLTKPPAGGQGQRPGPVEEIERERYEILQQLEDWLETPVLILGFLWLILLVVELIWGLHPFLNALVYVIWAVFVLDFFLRFFLAPHKGNYLRKSWLTALSLFIPALRIGRIARLAPVFRAARAARGLRLVSLVSSLNRGMRSLRRAMRRRGFGYVLALTFLVTLAGAAGMLAFEGRVPEGQPGLHNYGEALWWTAMIMTTLGSDYWPQTAEGQMLTLLLSLYAFAVFGYVTASLASFFIGAGSETAGSSSPPGLPGEDAASLKAELAALRREIALLRRELPARPREPDPDG